MGRGPQPFRERDVTRFLKAIVKAGLDVERFEKEGGKMTAFIGRSKSDGETGKSNDKNDNPWDEVLSDATNKKRTT
jgi:hypothetical protein